MGNVNTKNIFSLAIHHLHSSTFGVFTGLTLGYIALQHKKDQLLKH